MTLYDIVIARESLQKLIAQELPVRAAYQVARLADRLNVSLNFYGDEMIKAATMDSVAQERRQAELLALEVPDSESLPRVRIPLDGTLRLSGADIKCLEPFVEFYEPQEAAEGR